MPIAASVSAQRVAPAALRGSVGAVLGAVVEAAVGSLVAEAKLKLQVMEVDDALALLGRFGKWQVAVYSLCCTSAFVTVCWQMLAFVFVGK